MPHKTDGQKSQSLELASENLIIGGWEYNIKTQTMFWTDRLYDIHGFKPDQFKPGSKDHIEASLKCYNSKDRPWILEKFEKCEKEGVPYEFECEFTKYSGEKIWIHTAAVPVIENGQFERVVGHVMDISGQKIAERRLRESQERYLRVVNTIRDAVIIANIKGEILFVNSAFCEMYQYSQDEALGMHATILIHPDYHHVFQKFSSDVKKKGVFSGETTDLRKDGTTFFADIKGARIKFTDQECMLAVVRDISERKEYEKRLSNATIEWQSTFDATNNVIWLLDKDNTIIRSNKIAESVFNMPLDSLIGRKCWEVVHGSNEPIADCPFCKGKNSLERESTEIQLDNSWLEITIDPIQNSEGEFEKAVHIITDITKRKQAEISLQESEVLYRALFKENLSIMLLIDPKTSEIVDANPSACLYYGYPRQTITSMKISDINILSKEELQSEMLLAASEKRNYFNFRHRLANGSVKDVEVYSGPIKFGGRQLLCSIIHDISERKTIEKDRENLIVELKNALDEIKTLKGIVPICSYCKKIRDDKGFWNHLESYIQKHSEASFSHGMCPECQEELYGDETWFIKMKKKQEDNENE